MKEVIIGYRYNRQQLFEFLKDCEKNKTTLQNHAYTYTYDGTKWLSICDRGEGIEDEMTTDEFVQYMLEDMMGEFWIVRK